MSTVSSDQADFLKPPRLPAIYRREAADSRLSYSQEALWFLMQLDPSTPFYNDVHLYRLRGWLDTAALQTAVDKICARHSCLRSVFLSERGRPFRSHRSRLDDIEVVDLTGFEEDIRMDCAIRSGREAFNTPFDLERGPLMKLKLFRLGAQDHFMLLSTHHIVFDAWSRGLFLDELLRFHEAAARGMDVRLPEPRICYDDYVAWEREWMKGDVLKRHMSYWKRQLAGFPPVLEIPTDRPRPRVQTHRGASCDFQITADTYDDLRSLCRLERVTLSMALLAAFQSLLSRYSGQEKIVVGVPFANRSLMELQGLIGYFVNTLPLSVDLSGNPSFRELLQTAKEVTLSAQSYQTLPFEKLVADLNPVRDPSRMPVYQVIFNMRYMPRRSSGRGPTVLEEIPFESGVAGFDLNLEAAEQPDGVHLSLKYDADLFDPATAMRMMEHCRILTESAIKDPDQRIGVLPIMSEAERRPILNAACGPTTSYPGEKSISELFAIQLNTRLAAIALIDGERRLSYEQLDQRAEILARILRDRGAGEETVVGICLDRSADAIMTMLGILKVGAAYMPLDPADPPARIATLIAEAGAGLIVTRRALSARLAHVSAGLIRVEDLPEELQPSARPLPEPRGGNRLACVLFTSGSEGRPKGVEVPHRGIARLLFGQHYADLGPAETILQLAPLSFDASTFEIWGALLHGGTLVIHPGGVPALDDMDRTIVEHSVTTMWLNASFFNAIIDERPKLLAPLRQLLIGGEALSPWHVRRALEILPNTQIINGYGPTENTTFSSCFSIPRPLEGDARSIPIGRPLCNSSVYVLDDRLQPVPHGVTGEIHVGGHGVTRGYRGRADLTAERFLPDPFCPDPGARLYRTGDLGAVLADGNIEFRGRRDNQLKIRGFRIEPGEIEGVINSLPGVRGSTVQMVEAEQAGPRLIAFVVCENGTDGCLPLRESLRERLPSYMLPDKLILVDRLPLTARGKLDRSVLAGHLMRAKDAPKSPPALHGTAREATVLEIFKELLGHDDIGVDDDFFTAGGHSLLAVKLAARIKERLGVHIDLRQFFQVPSVAGICTALAVAARTRGEAGELWRYLMPVRTTGSGRPLFFVPGGDGAEGTMATYARLAALVPDRPLFGLRSTNADDDGERLLQPDVEALASAFVDGARQIQPHGPYDLAGGCVGGVIAFEMARILVERGETVRRLILVDTPFPSPRRLISQVILGKSSRIRFHIRRLLARGDEELGRTTKLVYDCLSHCLPFSERVAGASLKPVWLRFQETTLSYRPKLYSGHIHLIASEEMAATGQPRTWEKRAEGGMTMCVVRGSHWTFIREHIGEATIAFRRMLEGDSQAVTSSVGGDSATCPPCGRSPGQ